MTPAARAAARPLPPGPLSGRAFCLPDNPNQTTA